MILTVADLIRAAPSLYRHMLAGWAAGGQGYREHRPTGVRPGVTPTTATVLLVRDWRR